MAGSWCGMTRSIAQRVSLKGGLVMKSWSRSGRTSPLRVGRVLVRSQRQEVLRAADRLAHTPPQRLQIFAALDEIDLRSVHDQQIRRRVVEEEMFIGFHYFFQIVVADRLLTRRALFFQTLLQDLWRGLQVDDEVGCRHVLPE